MRRRTLLHFFQGVQRLKEALSMNAYLNWFDSKMFAPIFRGLNAIGLTKHLTICREGAFVVAIVLPPFRLRRQEVYYCRVNLVVASELDFSKLPPRP